eukprot:COSAG06_NODE_43929_length_367_cov_4.723881_1_plen_20_part_10
MCGKGQIMPCVRVQSLAVGG